MDKRILELESEVSDKQTKLTAYEKIEKELDDVVMQAAEGTCIISVVIGLQTKSTTCLPSHPPLGGSHPQSGLVTTITFIAKRITIKILLFGCSVYIANLVRSLKCSRSVVMRHHNPLI